jgi:hypothetical protein
VERFYPGHLNTKSATGYRKFFEEEISAENFEAELKKAIDSGAGLNKKDYFIDRTEPE